MAVSIRAKFRIALFFAVFLFPHAAIADIYKYQTASGEIIFTTEPRSDLKLIEVIGSSGKAKKPKAGGAPSAKASNPSGGKDSGAKAVPPPTTPPRDPTHAYDAYIREASEKYGIPFAFIKAVIRIESYFNPRAVSRAGAMGLMQLMPGTARQMQVDDPFDPRQNIMGGTRYLRHLSDRYDGDINLILAAYNAGPGNVAKVGGIPFEGTQRYVRNVYTWYLKYREMEP